MEIVTLGEKFRYIGFWDDDLIAQKGCISVVRGYIQEKHAIGIFDFAVGLNMPVKTCVFTAFQKYSDKGFRNLTSSEYTQAAGRDRKSVV